VIGSILAPSINSPKWFLASGAAMVFMAIEALEALSRQCWSAESVPRRCPELQSGP
jgi:hypothetical protein